MLEPDRAALAVGGRASDILTRAVPGAQGVAIVLGRRRARPAASAGYLDIDRTPMWLRATGPRPGCRA